MNTNLSDLIRAIQGLRTTSPVIALMSDDVRLPDPVAAVQVLPRHSLMIARSRDTDTLHKLVLRLKPVCRRRHVALLVANDARLAHILDADGVHVSETALRRCPRRPAPDHPGWIVTTAAHDERAICRAEQAGVDAVLLSPVFPTESHPGGQALGILRFAELVRRSRVPVLALGGINARTARRLRHSGAAGVAGVGFGQT